MIGDVLSNLFQVNLSHTLEPGSAGNPKAFFVFFSMFFLAAPVPGGSGVAKFQNMLPIALKALTEDRGC